MNIEIKEKGITLIALVVTIIILLILLSVTIAQVSGDNGLFQKTKQATDKYNNDSEKEEIELGKLERYITDFSIVGEDSSNSGEGKASIKIVGLTAEAITTDSIKVTVTIDGNVSKIEYSIDNGDNWKTGDSEATNECTFADLELGEGYFARVKAYDENGRYVEAISKVIILNEVTTAEEPDVLNGETFMSKGKLKTGTMKNNGKLDKTISPGENFILEDGYYSGGTILGEEVENDSSMGKVVNKKTADISADGTTTISYEVEEKGVYIVFVAFAKGYKNCTNGTATASVSGGQKIEELVNWTKDFGFDANGGGVRARVYSAKVYANEGDTINVVANRGNGYPTGYAQIVQVQ